MQHTTITEARAAAHRAEHGYGYCTRCESEVDSNDRCDCDACDYCGVRGDHEKHDGETVCAECADDMALAPVERIAPSKVAA